MTFRTNNAEGAPLATALAPADTGGVSGDQFSTVTVGTGTPSFTAVDTNVLLGTKSYRVSGLSADSITIAYTEAAGVPEGYQRIYFKSDNFPSAVGSASAWILRFQGTAGAMAGLRVNAAGAVLITDATAAVVYTSPAGTVPFDSSVVVIEWAVQNGTASGASKIKLRVWKGTPLAVVVSTELTAQNFFRAGGIVGRRIGKIDTGNGDFTYRFDGYEQGDTYTLPGPIAPPATGLYDIIIGVGQSNVRGAAQDFDATTDIYPNTVFQWSGSSIISAAEPLHSDDTATGMGVINRYARAYAANRLGSGRKILIVQCARGGSGFSTPDSNGGALTWQIDSADNGNNLYENAKDTVTAALTAAGVGSQVVAVLANFGQTDGVNNLAKATFKTRLQAFVNGFRAYLGNNALPFLMMQMRPDQVAADGRFKNIDDAQAETAAALPSVKYALSPNGSQYFVPANSVDFSAAGVREIGQRLYDAMNAIIPPVVENSIYPIRYILGQTGVWKAYGNPDIGEATANNPFRISRVRGKSTFTIDPPVDPPTDPPTQPQVGSFDVGDAQYPLPTSGTWFAVDPVAGSDTAAGTLAAPFKTVARAIAVAATGQPIVLREGIYNESLSWAGKAVILQAAPGEAVWFDGSIVVTGWVASSTWWQVPWATEFDHSASFTQGSDAGNFVGAQNPMAAWPDGVWINGARQTQVATGVTPVAGQFEVNYTTNILRIGTSPVGKEVRVSNKDRMAIVNGPGSKLLGFGVRRYATSLPQIGTVYNGAAGTGCLFENLVITDNATQGLSFKGDGCIARNITSTFNGMTGVHSDAGLNIRLEYSIMSNNNSQNFNPQPSSGGVKFTRTTNAVLHRNLVENNLNTMGLWCDVDCLNTIFTYNTVRGHGSQYGIFNELGEGGIIAGNLIDGAKYGITCFDTGNVKVFNNQVRNCSTWYIGNSQDARKGGGPDAAHPRILRNIQCCNNVIDSPAGTNPPLFEWYALDKETNVAVDAMNMVINGNWFYSTNGTSYARMVGWGQGDNVTVTLYSTPAALAAAKNPTWNNRIHAISSPTQAQINAQADMTVPLPADVAAALGKSTGAKILGIPV